MKNLKKVSFLYLLFAISTLSAYAQVPATLTIFSEDGHRFWVVIDGERQNADAAHRVVIPNLTKDFYRARIIFEDERFKDVSQHVQLVDADNQRMNVTYAIRERKGAMVLRVSSFEPALANAPAVAPQQTPPPAQNPAGNRPQTATPATSQSNQSVTVRQQTPGTQSQTTITTTDNISIGTSINVDGEQMDMNINLNGLPGMTTTTTTSSTTRVNANQSQAAVRANPEPATATAAPANTCVRAVANDQFQRGVNSIKNESFAENQMRIARQFTRNNCLSVNQIVTIMGLFSFEQNKLEYAKFAYDFCVDKGNYFMVNDAFSFSSSKTELNKFLESRE